MKLAEYLDATKLRRYINSGLVTERLHDTLPLAIYCYGRKAVYDNVWDDVTTKTRGLIVDLNTGDIVARPYEKFFSVDQMPPLLDEAERQESLGIKPVITEKVNGCLGIFWKYGIHWGIASKGSFHSPHAKFATEWMEKHIEEFGTLVFPEGYTPVFEIICQEVQPHVIKYDNDGLVLLDFININTGEELYKVNMHKSPGLISYANINHLAIARIFGNCSPIESILKEDSEEIEGYVATYNRPGKSPLKLKIKFPTFLKNRKIFYEEQKRKENPKNDSKYAEIFNEASTMLRDALVSCTTRKEFAQFFVNANPELVPVCFAMMDERDHKDIIWKIVERHDRIH